MAKYINADDIEYTKKTFCYGPGWYELDEKDEADVEFVLKKEIDEMPAADVRPNVRGEWVYQNGKTVCSVCHGSYRLRYEGENNFCPNCGADNRPKTTSADMRGEK